MEQMIGSFGPKPDGTPYSNSFPTEVSPSGMLARSGEYNVRSRVVDDDKQVYAGTSPHYSSYPAGHDLPLPFRFRMEVQARKGVVKKSV